MRNWMVCLLLAVSATASDVIRKCLSDVTDGRKGGYVVVFKGIEEIDDVWSGEPAVVLSEIGNETGRSFGKRDKIYLFGKTPLEDILQINWNPAKFVVVVKNQSEIKKVFEEFWYRRIFDVAVMVYDDDVLRVYTYYPYSPDHCESIGQPVFLGNCTATTTITSEIYPNKITNLHKCPLVITLVERSPAVVDNDGNPDGVETNVLHMIAASINATPVFIFLKDKLRLYRKSGNSIFLELIENRSHLVAGSLIYTKSAQEVSEGVEYPISMCITVAVPKITRPSYIHIFRNIIPWKILVAVIVSSGVVVGIPYVVFRSLNRTSSNTINAHCTMKVLLGMALVSTFFLNAIFDASVSSSVLAPKSLPQLESLDDVIKSPLLLDGDIFLMQEVLNEYIPRMRRGEICGCYLDQSLMQIAEQQDRAIVDVKFNLLYNLALVPELHRKIHVQDQCITTFRPVIQMRKHSPFLKPITKFLLALSESGIIKKAFDAYGRKFQKKTVGRVKPLTLNDFRGGFLLLGLGLSVSIALLALELIVFALRKRRF